LTPVKNKKLSISLKYVHYLSIKKIAKLESGLSTAFLQSIKTKFQRPSQVQWHTPIISAFRRLRQEDHEFKTLSQKFFSKKISKNTEVIQLHCFPLHYMQTIK
jgi:hypothetical protein